MPIVQERSDWNILPDDWPEKVKTIIITVRKTLRNTRFKSKLLESIKKELFVFFKDLIERKATDEKLEYAGLPEGLKSVEGEDDLKRFVSKLVDDDEEFKDYVIKYEQESELTGKYHLEDFQAIKTSLLECIGYIEELLAVNYDYFNSMKSRLTNDIKKVKGGLKWINSYIDPVDGRFRIIKMAGLKMVANTVIQTTRTLTPLFQSLGGKGVHKINMFKQFFSEFTAKEKAEIMVEDFDAESFFSLIGPVDAKSLFKSSIHYAGNMLDPEDVELAVSVLSPEKKKEFFQKLFGDPKTRDQFIEILKDEGFSIYS